MTPQILDVKPCVHVYNQSHTQISEPLQGGRTHTQHIPCTQTHTGADHCFSFLSLWSFSPESLAPPPPGGSQKR